MTDIAELTVLAAILPGLQKLWHLTPFMKASLMSVVFLGIFIGSLICGFWSDRWGRRSSILASLVGLLIFGPCIACSWAPHPMLGSRFFFGVAMGLGVSPILSVLVESSPISWRSKSIVCSEFTTQFGGVVGAALLCLFMNNLDVRTTYAGIEAWRIVVVLATSPALLVFPFAFSWLQESPMFLAVNGRNEEALEVLNHMASMNQTEHAVADLKPIDIAIDLKIPEGPSEDTRLLQGLRRADYWENISALMREYKALFLGSIWLCFLCNFLLFGQAYALPQIFEHLGAGFLSPAAEILLTTVCNITGTFISYFCSTLDGVGQRDCISALLLSLAVSLCFLSDLEHTIPGTHRFNVALANACLANAFECAVFNQVYIFVAEVFPSSCRVTAVSTCTAVGRFAPMFAPMLFEYAGARHPNGDHALFWIVQAILCVASIAVVRFCLGYELKGRPLAHETCMLPGGSFAKDLSQDGETAKTV